VLPTLIDPADGQKIADAAGISLNPILIGNSKSEAPKKRLKIVAYLLTGCIRAAASSLFGRQRTESGSSSIGLGKGERGEKISGQTEVSLDKGLMQRSK
jgi:hypothetical protein